MSYKLKINNKIFEAIDADSSKITIPLDNNNDVIYFKNWQDKSKNSNSKKDYIEDIEFTKITENGTLYSCFPILNENETMVAIYYDYKQIKN